jgi:hypothetical protein
VLPVAFTGTEHFLSNLRRWRRSTVRMAIGKPFRLDPASRAADPEELRRDTTRIMAAIADLLPESYRGAYGRDGGGR